MTPAHALSRLLPIACVLGLAGCASDPAGPPRLSLPAQLHSCETNTARLCTTWELADGIYLAEWSNGSTAEIEAVRFGSDVVVFERRDTGGPTADMHAFYYGIPVDGEVMAGVVVWNTGGLTFEGRWEASWTRSDP